MAAITVFAATASHAADSDSRRPATPAVKPDEPPLALRRDAELTDVQFLDAALGWAVGDRGTIWHTANGGATWRLQPTGSTARLEAVSFVDAQRGWAAGGHGIPYTPISRGLLLRTEDGGQTWTPETKATLPRVTRLKMFGSHGWAAGSATSLFPSGLFQTTDDGRTWSTLPCDEFRAWQAGDFLDPRTAVLADVDGRMASVYRGRLSEAAAPQLGPRRVRRIKMASATNGWAAGDGGLVLQTIDGGRSWRLPAGQLPPLIEAFDIHALDARGDDVWLTGTPGTLVFHSGDGGRNWSTLPTAQTAPLRALTFVDRHRGWAVGSLGVILGTRDGGRTWRVQQRGGSRAAALFVCLRPSDVPLELVAQLGGNDGQLSVVHVLNGRVATEADRRARDAMISLGASVYESTSAYLDEEPGADVDQLLVSHLTRVIRTWRPDVIVTHDPAPNAARPLAAQVGQRVLQAVELAAADRERSTRDTTPDAADDAQAATDARALLAAGLPPWQVRRVVATLDGAAEGSWSLSTGKIAPRLGRTLADAVVRPRGLIHAVYAASPERIAVRVLAERSPQGALRGDLFDGLAQQAGESRRGGEMAPVETLTALQRSAAARRSVQALMDYARRQQATGGWLAQVEQLTRDLDAPASAELIFQLAAGLQRRGQFEQAADAYELLLRKHPQDPLAQAALLQAARYYGSGEVRHRLKLGSAVVTAGVKPAASAETNADRLAAFADKTYPVLAAEPEFVFPLVSALRRRAGAARDSERLLQGALSTRPRDAWSACLAGEAWLAQRRGTSPKPVLKCANAKSKPRLDGQLGDALWQAATPIVLVDRRHPQTPRPTELHAAYDDEYLYVAVRARKVRGLDYGTAADDGVRQRDTGLAARDRVEIVFDVDRDFATGYSLAIDHRGWAGESLCGETGWNPQWFIAAGEDQAAWRIEAAIPWRELIAKPPRTGDAWAVGVQRIVPGFGRHDWNGPFDADEPLPTLGYLIFE